MIEEINDNNTKAKSRIHFEAEKELNVYIYKKRQERGCKRVQ
jgi:hypothetical protein